MLRQDLSTRPYLNNHVQVASSTFNRFGYTVRECGCHINLEASTQKNIIGSFVFTRPKAEVLKNQTHFITENK